MKKYLLFVISIILLVCTFNYLYYFDGRLFINYAEPKDSISKNENTQLLIQKKDKFEPFHIQGVNLSLGKPGYYPTEMAIEKSEYLRWFKQIQQLGANTIQLLQVANPDFYEALYEFNTKKGPDLYLIQGISVEEDLIESNYDAFDKKVTKQMEKNCRNTVDVVHGRFKRKMKDSLKSWNYKSDVSDWVYAYRIGTEWPDDFIVYTNEHEPKVSECKGEYLTIQDANNFEVFLTYTSDQMIQYENKKYSDQHAITWAQGMNSNPLPLEEDIRFVTKSYGPIDINKVSATKQYESAIFASLPSYPFSLEYIRYKNPEIENTNLEYLKQLRKHYEVPLVISGFGSASSRGKTFYEPELSRDDGNNTEQKQGENIVSLYKDIQKAKCNGAILNGWQDEWHKMTWNTEKTVKKDSNAMWHDIQSANQSYGLLAFDTNVCHIDGKTDEWKPSDQIMTHQNYALSMKYGAEGVYFLVEKEGLNLKKDTFYIPIDTLPETGSKHIKNVSLETSHKTDFLIEINGEHNSQLWVNSRYNPINTLYEGMITFDRNPFIDYPAKMSDTFEPVEMILNNQKFYFRGKEIPFSKFIFSGAVENYRLSETFETGKLVYGNTNPKSKEFNSIADFYSGKDCVEIRIPWQMLNVSDPVHMEIHKDYYDNYGVEHQKISSIRVGIGNNKQTIPMKKIKVEKLAEHPEYKERLKKSYYMLKECWNS